MKKISSIIAILCLLGEMGPCNAQSVFESGDIRGYKLSIYNVAFDTTTARVAIPLKYYGLRKFNYSVLVKVRLRGDTSFYSIPGILPSGDSFKFLQKSGNRTHGDTLVITRRNGDKPIVVSEIRIFAFRRNNKQGILKENHAFTKFILENYVGRRNTPVFSPEMHFVAGRL